MGRPCYHEFHLQKGGNKMGMIRAGEDDAGMRLDRWIRRKMPLTGLSPIYRMIRTGKVRVNGKKITQNYRLAEGDGIDIDAPDAELEAGSGSTGPAAGAKLAETDFFRRNFRIIFEDDDLLACDKPPNLVVHSGTGHVLRDTLIDLAGAYMSRGRHRGEDAPGPYLVHRLDRDTSGIILIAKNRRTVSMLHEAIRTNKMEKTYIALCHGRPATPAGVIDVALSRNFEARDGTKVQIAEDGQRALSRYWLKDTRRGISRLEVIIDTGRTHQIRVHTAHISCPVIGDVRYGDKALDEKLFAGCEAGLRRLYLHAWRIRFYYPAAGKEITLEAALPGQFDGLWNVLAKPAGQKVKGRRNGT
jgi:RluA family pseudouridine synthase